MKDYTFDSNGIPYDKKGNPIAFIQTPFNVKSGYGYMVYYSMNNRYYKYCVINGVKGRVSRISFLDFMNVLKGETA